MQQKHGVLKAKTVAKLNSTEMEFWRRSARVSRKDKIRNIIINLLTPNDPYVGRTAPLTPKRCVLYIYSTNIGTEYFKHALYSPFLFLFKMQCVS